MRTTEFLLMMALGATTATAQQPVPVAIPAPISPTPADAVAPAENTPLHQSALKFVEAADARSRLQQNLDKLLDDGKQALMKRDPLLNPKFADEWEKRMRQRVNLDEIVDSVARVYEKYYTSEELDQLAQAHLAMKQSKPYRIPPQLRDKLKANSPKIQTDINTETSLIGSRLGIEVGQQLEKDHPEWAKPIKPKTTPAHKS